MKKNSSKGSSIVDVIHHTTLSLILFGNAFAQQTVSTPKTPSTSHNCPTGYSFSPYGGPSMERYEIEGLSKKKYTISQFEEFTREIEHYSSEAEKENKRGRSYVIDMDPPDDTYRDLSGCKLRKR